MSADNGATEWGTNYWGDIESEPTEEHARMVASLSKEVILYSRSPMGAWTKVDK